MRKILLLMFVVLESTLAFSQKQKIMDCDFEISKPICGMVDENGKVSAVSDTTDVITFHISNRNFRSAGNTVEYWFEKGGEQMFKKHLSGETLKIVREERTTGYAYLIFDENFNHVTLMPYKSDKWYIVSLKTTER